MIIFFNDLKTDKKWVLLSLHLEQENKLNNTRIEFFINSLLKQRGV